MKRKQLYLLLSGALLLLSACSTDDTLSPQSDQGTLPIRLSSRVADDGATRSYNRLNIPSGRTVYAWADMINLSDSYRSVYFNGWSLTANGSGSLSSDETKFFPATNLLDIFAMSGTFSGYTINTKNVLPTTAGIYHTVSSDQRTEGAYYASDLLYAAVLNQEPTEEPVELPMYHMLSKIQVVLIPGTGNTTEDKYDTDILKTATVQLLNVETRALFKPVKDAAITPGGLGTAEDIEAARALRGAMITVAAKNSDDDEDYVSRKDILVETVSAVPNESGNILDTSYGDAIIVPQTIRYNAEDGTDAGKFIKVTLTDPGTGLTHDTYFRFERDFTFESGKLYRFRLTLDRIGDTYSLTPTIAEWTAEETSRPTDLK